jgi:hypothetical protein
MKNSVFIVILNWNGWKDTVECVESCLKITYSNFRILIVDNGSTDGSETILKKRFPEAEIIQTGSNLGFAGGNNVGIKYALEQGAEYIWLLNNDTIVDINALAGLVAELHKNPEAGIAASKIYYFSKPKVIWFAGGTWNPVDHIARHNGLDEEDARQYDVVAETDFATGCSLLFKASLISKIGYLKEDYYLYWEDVDWCVNARKNGWKIIYVPNSHVWHKVSQSVENKSSAQNYYYFRGGLLFYSRNAPGFVLRFAATHFVYSLKQFLCGDKSIFLGYLPGLKDFVLKRFGKRVQHQ